MRFNMKYSLTALLLCASPAFANVDIVGNVEAKCIIQTDKSGVYGNPSASVLSTTPADGGVLPVIRFDVALANYYTANITHPTSFSSSPSLTDSVAWTGSTSVTQTSDASMSGYEAAKVLVNNTTIFDLTVAGSTWFSTASSATYAASKPFAGGSYTAVVQATCIAK
jgi:hypothetical protein|tara:strand:- start:759 stop:1259 length:501 start_codon:yes stop_codon:yes gene_type:complete